MAKKKKSHKKQQFKYAAPTAHRDLTPAVAGSQPITTAGVVTKTVKGGVLSYEVANLSLIKNDIRKVAVLAVGFVALQLALWWLFEHTGLGAAVYHLIKV